MVRKIASIEWRDAGFNSGYDKHGLITLHTAGFVVHECDEYITLAADFMPEDNGYRNSSSIPKVNIISITYLRKGK